MLSAHEGDPPGAVLGALDAWACALVRGRPGGEAVAALVLDEQNSTERDRERLGAAEVAIVAVREREAVAQLDVGARSAGRRVDRGYQRRQRGVALVACRAEALERARLLGPQRRSSREGVGDGEARTAQPEQGREGARGWGRPGHRWGAPDGCAASHGVVAVFPSAYRLRRQPARCCSSSPGRGGRRGIRHGGRSAGR